MVEHLTFSELTRVRTYKTPYLLCFTNGHDETNKYIVQTCNSLCSIYTWVKCCSTEWIYYQIKTNCSFTECYQVARFLKDKRVSFADGTKFQDLEAIFKQLNNDMKNLGRYKFGSSPRKGQKIIKTECKVSKLSVMPKIKIQDNKESEKTTSSIVPTANNLLTILPKPTKENPHKFNTPYTLQPNTSIFLGGYHISASNALSGDRKLVPILPKSDELMISTFVKIKPFQYVQDSTIKSNLTNHIINIQKNERKYRDIVPALQLSTQSRSSSTCINPLNTSNQIEISKSDTREKSNTVKSKDITPKKSNLMNKSVVKQKQLIRSKKSTKILVTSFKKPLNIKKSQIIQKTSLEQPIISENISNICSLENIADKEKICKELLSEPKICSDKSVPTICQDSNKRKSTDGIIPRCLNQLDNYSAPKLTTKKTKYVKSHLSSSEMQANIHKSSDVSESICKKTILPLEESKEIKHQTPILFESEESISKYHWKKRCFATQSKAVITEKSHTTYNTQREASQKTSDVSKPLKRSELIAKIMSKVSQPPIFLSNNNQFKSNITVAPRLIEISDSSSDDENL